MEILILEPSLTEPGLYDGTWDGGGEGEYQVDVWAHAAGDRLGDASGFLEVRASHIELEGRLADRPLLKRLAAAGGGLFFEPDEVETIPDRLPNLSPTVTTRVEEDLWDSPHMFLGILLLLSGEWFLRRRRGLTLFAALVPSALLSAAPVGAADGDGDELRVAYIEHKTKGGWGRQWQYYGARNMMRFLRQLQSVTDIRVSDRPESVSLRDQDLEHLFEYPILFMTSNYAADLSPEEIGNMREYLLRGGFILADDCILEGTYSRSRPPVFTRGFIEVMAEVFPTRSLEVIADEHPVYHCVYDFPDGLPRMHLQGPWEGLGMFDGDRLMVLLSPNDICCGWQFSWGQRSTNAYRMGINIFVYALTH